MSSSSEIMYKSPEPYDGDSIDMTWAGFVTIWCFVAPTTGYSVMCGSENTKIPQTLNRNNGDGSHTVSIIDTIGRYTVPGNCWVELIGGIGGDFYISGGY